MIASAKFALKTTPFRQAPVRTVSGVKIIHRSAKLLQSFSSSPRVPMASDSDDEDLKKAIALSMSASQPNFSREDEADRQAKREANVTRPQTSSAMSGILGLDRKAMEQERLARLSRKRERSISSPPSRSSRKTPKLEAETITLPSGAMLRSFSTLVEQDQQGRKSDIANAANKHLKRSPSPASVKTEREDPSHSGNAPPGSIKYPNGVVKKTWAFRHERKGDDVKLEEVLEPQTLKTAVMSAFQWNTTWVLAKLKTPLTGGSTKCAFVMQAKEDKLKQEMLEQTADWRGFLRLVFPSMIGQIHCMHSKLMLLFHPEKLRIAIPTANLLDFDWGESGVMENSVFMIDLPRRPDGGKTAGKDLTPFGRELIYYLKKQELDQDIRDGVLNFDFSATAGMAFVHTVGGANYGEEAERTGYPGLARAVRELGLPTDEDLEIDFAASSIGSLNDEYLRNIHSAARGEDMIARAAQASTKAKTEFFKKPQKTSSSSAGPAQVNIREQMRIYFPTHDTVTASTAGAAGTICLSRKWYESNTFPRQVFRDYRSTREGLLSHNKILYARGKQQTADQTDKGAKKDRQRKNVAWVYVGSANMSESAWGKLVYDAKAKKWKLNCRNWECGVLLPIPDDKLAAGKVSSVMRTEDVRVKVEGEDSETESEDEGGSGGDELVGVEVFDDVVKPPCAMPGEKYEGKEPWYFMEQR